MEIIKIKDITPAKYNPRKLSEAAFENLKASISTLGIIKPIIVREENMTIVAGHQRTKAMTALGITECPAFVLKGINLADEVRFNQIHNKCEYEVDPRAPKMSITCELKEGFNRVKNANLRIDKTGELAVLNAAICKMIIKYGEFGCPVVAPDGRVIISSAYAFAHKVLGMDLWVCKIPQEKVGTAIEFFSKSYGTFSYDHLEKKTYIQSLAQMKRLRDGKKGEGNSMRSVLYRTCVIPWLEEQPNGRKLRILDFGAGQLDYVKMLQKQGYNIYGYDPYHRVEGTMKLDYAGNKATMERICKDIKDNGLFDVVVCDSVLNSVDSMMAEESVIASVGALCKQDGMIFISGRPKEDSDRRESAKKCITKGDSLMHFLDENNFSALYRNGEWFYQKFHTADEQKRILLNYGHEIDGRVQSSNTSFQVSVKKTKTMDVQRCVDALRFEFNLILPNDKSYGMQDAIEEAYRYAVGKN